MVWIEDKKLMVYGRDFSIEPLKMWKGNPLKKGRKNGKPKLGRNSH